MFPPQHDQPEDKKKLKHAAEDDTVEGLTRGWREALASDSLHFGV